MLLVDACKGRSEIHGFGLIAQTYIAKGTVIWRFQQGFDVVLTEEQFQKLSGIAQQQVLYYAYYNDTRKHLVLSSDDDRFTNHSDNPNTALDSDNHSGIAIRDIQMHEEITWDYHTAGQSVWGWDQNALKETWQLKATTGITTETE